jgi:hypothetical protein
VPQRQHGQSAGTPQRAAFSWPRFASGQNSGLAGEGAGENQMKITSRRWWLASIAAAAVAVSAVLAAVASAGAGATSSKPSGLGQSSGLLPPIT